MDLRTWYITFAGQPKRSLDEWNTAKTNPAITYDRCYYINSSLFTVRDELLLNPEQQSAVQLALDESYDMMSRLDTTEYYEGTVSDSKESETCEPHTK